MVCGLPYRSFWGPVNGKGGSAAVGGSVDITPPGRRQMWANGCSDAEATGIAMPAGSTVVRGFVSLMLVQVQYLCILWRSWISQGGTIAGGSGSASIGGVGKPREGGPVIREGREAVRREASPDGFNVTWSVWRSESHRGSGGLPDGSVRGAVFPRPVGDGAPKREAVHGPGRPCRGEAGGCWWGRQRRAPWVLKLKRAVVAGAAGEEAADTKVKGALRKRMWMRMQRSCMEHDGGRRTVIGQRRRHPRRVRAGGGGARWRRTCAPDPSPAAASFEAVGVARRLPRGPRERKPKTRRFHRSGHCRGWGARTPGRRGLRRRWDNEVQRRESAGAGRRC